MSIHIIHFCAYIRKIFTKCPLLPTLALLCIYDISELCSEMSYMRSKATVRLHICNLLVVVLFSV